MLAWLNLVLFKFIYYHLKTYYFIKSRLHAWCWKVLRIYGNYHFALEFSAENLYFQINICRGFLVKGYDNVYMRNTYQIYIFKIYIPVLKTWNSADLYLNEVKMSKCL